VTRTTRTRVLAVLGALVAVAALACAASAFWTPAASNGPAASAAATVAAGATPTGTVSPGRAVTVAWAASTLSDGQPVDGYLVRRYDAVSGTAAAVGLGCTGTIVATSCVEAAVPPGTWRYTVTPLIGVNWRGAESPRSGIVTVGAATLTLATTQFGGPAAFPRTTTGTLAGFAANEGITYRLDAATALVGSPASAGPAGTAAITSLAIPAVADGAHTVWAIGNATVPSQASATIVVDRTAPTVSASAAPAPNGAGWNTSAPVTVTLTANDGTGVGGGQIRYTTDGSDPTISATAQTYAAPLALNVTTTVRFAASDALGNTSAVGSQLVRIDTTAPTDVLSLTGVTGGAFRAGGTVWYRGAAAGSFAIVNALTDAGSGPAASATAALAGTATGWSHVPGSVATPAGGPFTSAVFSWAAGTSSAPTQTITGTDVAGNAAPATLTFTSDVTGPAGGSVDATGLAGTGGRYSTSTTLSLALSKGSDAQSGLASTGARLLRATATLTSAGTPDGVCGAFGAFAQVGALDPASPVSDVVADGACYRYQYVVPDNVGNTTTFTSPDIKVDTTPPGAPVLTPAAPTGDTAITGSTVYINPQTGHSGGFQVQAVATDLSSGILKVAFPALAGFASGGGDDLVSPYLTTYAWGPAAVASGAQAVTATSNAGVSSAAASFNVVPDVTAPAGGALTVNAVPATAGGSTTTVNTTTIPITTRTDFAETTGPAAAGLLTSTLVRDQTTLVGGVCGTTWTTPTTLVGAPAQNALSGIASGNCYRYTLTGTDRVGNAAAISTIVQVDATAPAFGAPALVLSETGPYAFVSGTTAYYNGATGAGSSITVSAPTVADVDSGVASVTFPSPVGLAGGGSDLAAPFSATYTWSAATGAGAQTVVAANGSGLTSSAAFTLVRDVTAPAGGALTVNGGAASGAGSTTTNTTGAFAIGARTDFTETLGAASSGLASSVLVRDQAPLTGNACGTFGSPVTLAGAPAQAGLTTGCWRYTLTGIDNVGNAVSLTTTVKVDTSAATFGAPPLVVGGTGPYAFVSGTTAYYNGATGAGSTITVAAPTLADPDSGVAQVAWPAPAGFTGGGVDTVAPFGTVYTWAAATGAGAQTVTATNGSGLTSAASFTLVRDVTAPAGGALTVNGTAASAVGTSSTVSTPSFTIGARTDFTEALSGAAAGLASSTLVRDQATLTGATCGATWTTATTLTGTPVQNAGSGIATGNCYRYTLTGTDNVGNTAVLTTIVRVSRLFASNVVLANVTGATGRISRNDTVTITYSDVVNATTFCSTWTNTGVQTLSGAGQVVITVTNSGTSDLITVATTSGCTFHLGTIDTNADYVSGTATYSGTGTTASRLTWDPTARTLTLAFGSRTSGTRNTGVATSVPDYTPDPLIADLLGNTIAPGPFSGTLSGF